MYCCVILWQTTLWRVCLSCVAHICDSIGIISMYVMWYAVVYLGQIWWERITIIPPEGMMYSINFVNHKVSNVTKNWLVLPWLDLYAKNVWLIWLILWLNLTSELVVPIWGSHQYLNTTLPSCQLYQLDFGHWFILSLRVAWLDSSSHSLLRVPFFDNFWAVT